MSLSGETISEVTDLFKALSDPGRLKIIYTLSDSEMSVTELAESLEVEQSSLSHQLKILKNVRLVGVRREGRKRVYSLADDHVYNILTQVISHANEKR
ncbi:metalloregulator ArsR/SmtB family transcription factor [Alkalibacterium sp. s-m-22]|nr:metalloregulator ArsR/SmtB family transcription factor [Alkalibacterium thalassium]